MAPSIHKKNAVAENSRLNPMGRIHAGLSVEVDRQELADLRKARDQAFDARDGDLYEHLCAKVIVKEKKIAARTGMQKVTKRLDGVLGTARTREKKVCGETTKYQKIGDVGALRRATNGVLMVSSVVGLVTTPVYGIGLGILAGTGVGWVAAKGASQVAAVPSALIKQATNSVTQAVTTRGAKRTARERRRELDALPSQAAEMDQHEPNAGNDDDTESRISLCGEDAVSAFDFVG